MKDFVQNYINDHKHALESIPVEEVDKIISTFQRALREDRQIFVFGNGGSAANASHFITDLGKGASDFTYRRFRCLSINDNVSWITAIGNDYSYDDVFLRQLQNYARPGDIVFTMSVSGNSPNLVKAVEWCKQNQVYSIALVGAKRGKLAELADHSVTIDSVHYGRVEDCHMHICHMICYAFIEEKELQVEPK
ncbi:D-sedoheptulose-7-phosphate isomerase [Segetibacter aerophilus]|uniref:Phosphoheptose isomerase n=1 Tax=Segetibacter aerophilus TaxID=670293 RepID=A0A512B733_9BACT|nr:SIS domain-containing protein [Segetibacter aerophilus]GEO07769.1 phosphoheptose isomerase [Segetibacter aerophilus]